MTRPRGEAWLLGVVLLAIGGRVATRTQHRCEAVLPLLAAEQPREHSLRVLSTPASPHAPVLRKSRKSTGDRASDALDYEAPYLGLPAAGSGGTQPPTSSTAAAAARMPDVDPEHEDLTHSALGRYLTQRIDEDFLPLARQCYENVLAKHPAFESNAVVDFEIIGDPSGPALVDKAELKQRENKTDPEFSTCLRESMMTLRLDEPPEEMERISASFQFGFSPHEKD